MAHCEAEERAALRGPPDCVAHRAIGRAYMKQSYRSHHEFLAAEHAAQPDRDGEADDAARASAAGDEEKKNGEGAESHSGVVSRAMGAAMAASVIYVTPPVTDALGGSTDKVGVPFGKGNGVEEGAESGALVAPVMQDQGGGADREGQEEQEETRGQAVLLAQSKGSEARGGGERKEQEENERQKGKKEGEEGSTEGTRGVGFRRSKTDVATAGPARVDCGRMARFSRLNSYAPPLCQHDAGC